MPETSWPSVRVVVLNWNARWFTARCLRSLIRTDYPHDRLEIVVVDNGSHDGSLEQLRFEFPRLRFLANGSNLGFAEGCNTAMRDLGGVDHVALVNNDAFVEPGWLKPLIEASRSVERVGAVAALLVLEPDFARVDLTLDGGSAVIESVMVGGIDATDRTMFRGCRSVGRPEWPMQVDHHLDDRAELMVPCGVGDRTITVEVNGTGTMTAATGSGSATIAVGGGRAVVEVPAGPHRVELLNGLGTERGSDGEGRDRCFGVEVGGMEVGAPGPGSGPGAVRSVEGFCGGGVLLSKAMLDQVGLFDPRFFAYYEDMDLSWRARRAGWEIVAAPTSVIKHSFGGSGGSTSPAFFFLNYRNWLLTVARNGGCTTRRSALRSAFDRIKWAVKANVLMALARRRRPDLRLVAAWSRVVVGLLSAGPYTLVARNSRGAPGRGLLRVTRPPGARPRRRVRSLYQPYGRSPAPTVRPGGPLIAYVDVSAFMDNDQERGGAKGVLDEFLLTELPVEAIVVTRSERTAGYRRLSPREMGRILGVEGPYASACPDAPDPVDLVPHSVVVVVETGGTDRRRHEPEAAQWGNTRVFTYRFDQSDGMATIDSASRQEALLKEILDIVGTP